MPRREDLIVPSEQLRWRCDPALFGAPSTAELDGESPIIGQERALEALKLGIEIRSPGYNVFVSGLSGTGRSSAVHRLLVGLGDKCVDVPDKAFVHSFREPSRPRLLRLPRGKARLFAEAVSSFARNVARDLPELFESPDYVTRRRRLEESAAQVQRESFEAFAEECRLKGLAVVQVQIGQRTQPGLAVPIGEEVLPVESLGHLVKEGRIEVDRAALLEENAAGMRERLDHELLESRQALRFLEESLDEFDRNQARETISAELAELKAAHPGEAVHAFLEDSVEAILSNLQVFQARDADEMGAMMHTLTVNVVLDNSDRDDTPVLVEDNPTFTNLFGTIERRVRSNGDVSTDHTMIRPGALVRADGGYLILIAEDVLGETGAWTALKRVLRNGRLEIQPKESALGMAPLLFQPEAIPLEVKVILIGDAGIYAQLQAVDSEFRKTFKIRADFDSVMPRVDENVRKYGAFLARLAAAEDMLPFDASAMAAVAEYGARLCDHGGKISTHFSQVADVAREAHFFAGSEGKAQVSAAHLRSSLAAAERRENLYDRKLTERLNDGTVLIETAGARVGVVNGLTVYSSGRYSFGKPARITATVATGDAGLLNIEREVDLSGEIHDKGVLILTSYFRERFGQKHPLSFSASLCFEQNYGGIDGDSASSTELYALISALSEVGLDQGIAVTGSVNQKGEIQPIGGANEKIEGFFDVCRARGLTGTQGVIIPRQNVSDLMLSDEVVEAVEAGEFRVWSISHVDEGLEILTGWPVGSADAAPPADPQSLHAKVAARLLQLAEIARDFGKAGDGNKDEAAPPATDSEPSDAGPEEA